MPISRRVPLLRTICPFILVFAFAGFAAAADFASNVPALADWIESKLAPGQPLVLSVVNRSSLTAADAELIRRELAARLAAHLPQTSAERGASREAPGGSAVQATVTLAENLRNYVWVVELVTGGNREVHIVEFKRRRDSAAIGDVPQMLVRSQKVTEQESPILDFTVIEAADTAPLRMLVLEPGRLVAYVWEGARWKRQQAVPVPAPKVAVRELRGRLEVQADTIAVHLPGIDCAGKTLPALTLDCQEQGAAWKLTPTSQPLSWVPGRNYFEWSIKDSAGVRQPVAFYSSAEIDAGNLALRVIAALDGRTLLYELSGAGRDGEPAASWTQWGSDLAALKSGCGSGVVILATRPGDDTQPDALQAFEISDRQPIAVSPPSEMAGPVFALWPAENGATARAVVRNLGTRRYEAITLTIACGR
jgi:hypothetical protein